MSPTRRYSALLYAADLCPVRRGSFCPVHLIFFFSLMFGREGAVDKVPWVRSRRAENTTSESVCHSLKSTGPC
jgi:hypothetical protein